MTLLRRYSRKLLNLPALWLRRRLWRLHPKRFLGEIDSIPIDRPMFLLGVQGGELTLVARMLRRHPRVISITGNHTYWAGPDEMQNVMGPMLPPALAGLHHQMPPHPQYPDRGWLYATDDLLPLYRGRKATATAQMAGKFKRAIRLALAIHASPLDGSEYNFFEINFGLTQPLLTPLTREAVTEIAERQPRKIIVARHSD